MNIYDAPFFKAISSIADVLTLASIISGGIYAILNKTKSILAFTISKIIAGAFKAGIIIFVLATLFRLLEIVYIYTLIVFRSDFNSKNRYWENGYEISYVCAYFNWGVFFIFFSWIIGSLIWTGSINSTKMLFNFFLSPEKRLKIKHFQKLNIISAKYGTHDSNIDITSILEKMISGNSLEITASNKIAGDPIINVPKTLFIEYKYDNQDVKKIEIPENKTHIIKA